MIIVIISIGINSIFLSIHFLNEPNDCNFTSKDEFIPNNFIISSFFISGIIFFILGYICSKFNIYFKGIKNRRLFFIIIIALILSAIDMVSLIIHMEGEHGCGVTGNGKYFLYDEPIQYISILLSLINSYISLLILLLVQYKLAFSFYRKRTKEKLANYQRFK
jgi:hypothetical protein